MHSHATSAPVARHRTALRRSGWSRPIRLALEEGLINRHSSLFDYGCGHGDDVVRLRELGIECAAWDPVHRPRGGRAESDIVNLGYVINVIENSAERASALRDAWALARNLLIVSARLTLENKEEGQTPYEDGWLTRSGTFQKYYEQHELRDWIDNVLGVSSVPAAPGIFYVFRDSDLKQSFMASRYRRRVAAPRQRQSDLLFEQNKELLEPLISFIASRGRLPDEVELNEASLIRQKFGSLQRAFAIVRRVTGAEQWERIREDRSQDLLVYLALSRFGGRPIYSQLPRDLRLDVRAFFSTYKCARDLADKLLFSAGDHKATEDAIRKATVGKATPSAIYVHTSALAHIPPVLRVYEGCARTYIGAVEGANIVKLHRDTPQVSYLSYPDFERDPHPTLAASLIVNLQTFRVQYREYLDSTNPPILHRKEEFLASDHLLHAKFARLTLQEERWHLYEHAELIGTREGWQKVLNEHNTRLVGHKLLRLRRG